MSSKYVSSMAGEGLKHIYKEKDRWYHTLLPIEAQDALFNAANHGNTAMCKERSEMIRVVTDNIRGQFPECFVPFGSKRWKSSY